MISYSSAREYLLILESHNLHTVDNTVLKFGNRSPRFWSHVLIDIFHVEKGIADYLSSIEAKHLICSDVYEFYRQYNLQIDFC